MVFLIMCQKSEKPYYGGFQFSIIYLQKALFPTTFIKYDFGTAAPVRNAKGFCIKTKPGMIFVLFE